MPRKVFAKSTAIPEEHKHVLNQRLADYKSGKSKPIPHEKLMRRVRATAKDSLMQPRISMITLGVKNLNASRKFYENGLGFPVRPESTGDVVFFGLASTWLGLYPRDLLAEDAHVSAAGSGFQGVTLAHNVRTKKEVNDVLDLAEKAGAKIMKPAQEVFWGGYSGYFADPDGFLWEVAYNPHFWIG